MIRNAKIALNFMLRAICIYLSLSLRTRERPKFS